MYNNDLIKLGSVYLSIYRDIDQNLNYIIFLILKVIFNVQFC
jgi:hypothetical protein